MPGNTRKQRWLPAFRARSRSSYFATARWPFFLWFGDSLISDLALLAGVILAGAQRSGLPVVLLGFCTLLSISGQRSAAPPACGMVLGADSRQQLSGLSLALNWRCCWRWPVNVGVSTMVDSSFSLLQPGTFIAAGSTADLAADNLILNRPPMTRPAPREQASERRPAAPAA